MQYRLTTVLAASLALGVSAAPSAPQVTPPPSSPNQVFRLGKREIPASSGTSALSAVQTVAAGESFDGGMVMYDRGVSCTGQAEGGDSDAVFILEQGASLSNVIIGPNQIEGYVFECSIQS
jgi:pectate lyase